MSRAPLPTSRPRGRSPTRQAGSCPAAPRASQRVARPRASGEVGAGNAAILPTAGSKMGLGLLSAALLFLGGSLIRPERSPLPAPGPRGSWRKPAGGQGRPEALSSGRGRPQAPGDGQLDAQGSTCRSSLGTASLASAPLLQCLSLGPSFSVFPTAFN